MWGFEHAGIVPDVVVMAKAIANGLPLSAIATVARARWSAGARAPTARRTAAIPVACAAGIAVLETIARRGPRRERRGARRGAAGPVSTGSRPRSRGSATCADPGLMIGVEFVTRPRDAASRTARWRRPLIARAADLGLLVLTCGSSAPGHPLDPADRRDRGRDQRGGRDLRRGAPDGLSRVRTRRSARLADGRFEEDRR